MCMLALTSMYVCVDKVYFLYLGCLCVTYIFIHSFDIYMWVSILMARAYLWRKYLWLPVLTGSGIWCRFKIGGVQWERINEKHTHTNIRICVCEWGCMCVCVWVYAVLCMFVCVQTHTHTHTRVNPRTTTHTSEHTYTHVHISWLYVYSIYI